MIHDCQKALGPGARDGQRKTCLCGNAFEFVMCDGALGSYWVPFIRPIHNENELKQARKRARKEAQRVWSDNTGKPTGGVWNRSNRGRWKNRRKVA